MSEIEPGELLHFTDCDGSDPCSCDRAAITADLLARLAAVEKERDAALSMGASDLSMMEAYRTEAMGAEARVEAAERVIVEILYVFDCRCDVAYRGRAKEGRPSLSAPTVQRSTSATQTHFVSDGLSRFYRCAVLSPPTPEGGET